MVYALTWNDPPGIKAVNLANEEIYAKEVEGGGFDIICNLKHGFKMKKDVQC